MIVVAKWQRWRIRGLPQIPGQALDKVKTIKHSRRKVAVQSQYLAFPFGATHSLEQLGLHVKGSLPWRFLKYEHCCSDQHRRRFIEGIDRSISSHLVADLDGPCDHGCPAERGPPAGMILGISTAVH